VARKRARRAILWATAAKRDLDHIYSYFYLRSRDRDAARERVRRIVEAAGPLASMPDMGQKSAVSIDREYRELVFERFRVYYRIEPRQIVIVRVWDSRRNPEDFFLEEA
jgi:plasmid stabilization system protein ParE